RRSRPVSWPDSRQLWLRFRFGLRASSGQLRGDIREMPGSLPALPVTRARPANLLSHRGMDMERKAGVNPLYLAGAVGPVRGSAVRHGVVLVEAVKEGSD